MDLKNDGFAMIEMNGEFTAYKRDTLESLKQTPVSKQDGKVLKTRFYVTDLTENMHASR